MFRRTPYFILLLITAISCERLQTLSGIKRVTLQPIVKITPPPIVDGEFNTYGIYPSITATRPERIKTVLIRRVLASPSGSATGSGVQAFRITAVTSEINSAAESTVVYVSREDLSPLISFHILRTPEETTGVIARYQEASVEIISPETTRSFPTGALTFDVYELDLLTRAINFVQPKPLHILVVVPNTTPAGGMSVLARVVHCGTDTITTPAGTFDCYKLNLKTPDSTTTFWLEKIGARRLIQRQTIFTHKPDSTGPVIKLLSSTKLSP